MVADDLSDEFFRAGEAMAGRLGIDFVHLLYVMNVESIGVRSSAMNPDGKAVGLIQMMPATLKQVGFGGTPEQFQALSAEQQLPYVEKYLQPWTSRHLDSAARIYRAVFMPATLDAPGDLIVAKGGTRMFGRTSEATIYATNASLDPLKTGQITESSLDLVVRQVAQGRLRQRLRDVLARYSAAVGRAVPGVLPALRRALSVGPFVGLVALGGGALALWRLSSGRG
jgi:hypothetical protein